MNNRTLLVVAVVVIVVAGVAYAMGHRNADNQPQGVLGNAMAGISDKIDQASNQAKADASGNSAQQHFDSVKSALGIHPDNGSSD
jgi:hypothetical protein